MIKIIQMNFFIHLFPKKIIFPTKISQFEINLRNFTQNLQTYQNTFLFLLLCNFLCIIPMEILQYSFLQKTIYFVESFKKWVKNYISMQIETLSLFLLSTCNLKKYFKESIIWKDKFFMSL